MTEGPHRIRNLEKARLAPKCGARRKRDGQPCQRFALPIGRCALRGGKSTGPRTPEGLERCRQAVTRHGFYSAAAKAERREARLVARALRELIGMA